MRRALAHSMSQEGRAGERCGWPARISREALSCFAGSAGQARGQFCARGQSFSPRGADHLDVEIPDLLAKRVPVEPQQFGSLDLVAAGRGQRGADQGLFHIPQDTVVEAGWRQVSTELAEIGRKMPLDRSHERVIVGTLL